MTERKKFATELGLEPIESFLAYINRREQMANPYVNAYRDYRLKSNLQHSRHTVCEYVQHVESATMFQERTGMEATWENRLLAADMEFGLQMHIDTKHTIEIPESLGIWVRDDDEEYRERTAHVSGKELEKTITHQYHRYHQWEMATAFARVMGR